jgi:hypothetical protein
MGLNEMLSSMEHMDCQVLSNWLVVSFNFAFHWVAFASLTIRHTPFVSMHLPVLISRTSGAVHFPWRYVSALCSFHSIRDRCLGNTIHGTNGLSCATISLATGRVEPIY